MMPHKRRGCVDNNTSPPFSVKSYFLSTYYFNVIIKGSQGIIVLSKNNISKGGKYYGKTC